MSKQALQKAALERSGISYDESTEATLMQPSLYERLGQDGMKELSTRFYDKVFQDKKALWFVNIFSSSTRDEAIENQYLFFVQTFGGPPLYQEKKGTKYTRLVGRHANYHIGPQAADRWVEHMIRAMQEHSILAHDADARQKLEKYFRYTAHYIVVAMEYMRPDQVRAINPCYVFDDFLLFCLTQKSHDHIILFDFSVEWWYADRCRSSLVVSTFASLSLRNTPTQSRGAFNHFSPNNHRHVCTFIVLWLASHL